MSSNKKSSKIKIIENNNTYKITNNKDNVINDEFKKNNKDKLNLTNSDTAKNKLNEEYNVNNDETNKNNKDKLSLINSNTAKNGLKEEYNVIDDFNTNENLHKEFEKFIKKNIAKTFSKFTNNQSKIDICNTENIYIQVKKYKKGQFGQIDRHWIHDIVNIIPSIKVIEPYLKNLCEYPLKECGIYVDKNKSIKKLNNTNYTTDELNIFIENINKNKKEILNYAFCGYGNVKPQYLCGIEYNKNNKRIKMLIFNINDILTYLEKFEFKIKKSETVIELGDCFTLQRKGGDCGKKASNQLQFKLIFSKLNINERLEYFF